MPFVGLFIARISPGRTIREFVLTVLTVPTLFTFVWFAVFGGSVLDLEHYPFAGLLLLAAIFILIVFFITSAVVLNYKEIVWGLSLSAVAIVLLTGA